MGDQQPDLDRPGWAVVAGEWRWTGAGDPPPLLLRTVHEDYCDYPDCTCPKVQVIPARNEATL